MMVRYAVSATPCGVTVTKTVQGLQSTRTEATRRFRSGLFTARCKAQQWIETDFARMQAAAELAGSGKWTCEVIH